MIFFSALALSLVAQDPTEPARRPFRAQLTIERFVKREDAVALQTAALSVRPGEALALESARVKLVIREGTATERRSGEKTARRWDLSKPENFQPVDLWRLDANALRRRFRVITDRAVESRELPESVVTAEGKQVPPVSLKSAASLLVADGVDRAEGCARVVLVPTDPRLRERISSIRLSVDRGSALLLRAVVDAPTQILTLTLGEYREVASLEDATFDLDLSNFKVEER
jgi:hypothetical protein